MEQAMFSPLSRTKINGLCHASDNPRHITRSGRTRSLRNDIERLARNVFRRKVRQCAFETGAHRSGDCRMREASLD
jgi:hypothetical protein